MKSERRRRVTTRELMAELRRSEAQYRSTIDSMTDALHVVDRDLRIVLMNRAFLDWHERLGLTGDAVGKLLNEVYDFLPPSVEEEYRKVFKAGELLTTEELTTIGDREITTETRKIPICERGKVVKVITIVRDITERKCMEKALRLSEAKFKTLAEQSPNMIFMHRMGKIVYVNKKCAEIMGYTREEFYAPGFDFLCVAAPESITDIAGGYSAYLEGRGYHSHEATLITKSGRRIDCIVAWSAVDYGDGKAMLGVVTDITGRKDAERSLRISEEKYRSFVENFHGIAYRGGSDGAPIFFHGDVRRITGYAEEEFLRGMPAWTDIVLPEDRQEPHGGPLMENPRGGVQPAEREYRIRRRDGEIRWIHQSLRPVRDESGAAMYLQGALYDVTARRVAEDKSARERSAFGSIVDAATTSKGPPEVCEKVLCGLIATLGFDCGVVRLYDRETRTLNLVCTHGFTPSEVDRYLHDQHIDDSRGIAALVGRTLKAVWAPDVSHSEEMKEYRHRCSEVRVRSMIGWPLVSSDRTLLGVMHLMGRTPRDIPEEDRVFFRTVGDMFVVVLEWKQAEQSIKSSEARYRSHFENSP